MSNNYIVNYQNNMNETKKLKNELLKLESMEGKYIENLKKTKESIKRNYDDNIRYNNFQKIKIIKSDNKNKKRLANSAQKRNYNNLMNLKKNTKNKSISIPKK